MKMCRKTKAYLLMIETVVLLHLARTPYCRMNGGFKFVWNTAD